MRRRIRLSPKKASKAVFQYLDKMRDVIRSEQVSQGEILSENAITDTECINRIVNIERNLWERVLGQNDFLRLRIGIGNVPIDAQIDYPKEKFSLEDDVLQDAVQSLKNEPTNIEKVPVTVSLRDDFVFGAIGNRQNVLGFIRSLLLQALALHSPDELKIVIISNQSEVKEWEYLKFVPHIWDDNKQTR